LARVTGQQWVNVPLPRTLNVDTSPGGLDADESPLLTNVVTWEPGQIRQRKRFTRVASVTALTAAGDLPCTVITSPNLAAGVTNPTTVPTRAIVTYLTGQSGAINVYRAAYPNGPFPSGYAEMAAGDVTGVFVNADNPNSVTTAAATGWVTSNPSRLLPFGQQAQADFSTFFTSICRFAAPTKTGATPTSCRLMRWGGQNRASLDIAANIANGATAMTLTSNVTPSLAGTFVSYDGAGGAADPVGKQFNYYVVSHVAGTANVVLSKPFGLGDATVPAHAAFADTASFVSAKVVKNSPPDIQQCCAYLSRMFVGRPSVLTAVGAIMPGTYPHAVAWSDPNEPEKWTDTSIAILDNNAGDVVQGFGVLQNALVIFRRYSTWVMTGTDETSFTFREASNEVGCLDARSISAYKNGLFFMSDNGLYFFDGYDFTRVTDPKPGHGIHTAYISQQNVYAYPETYPLSIQCTSIAPRTETLIMTGQNLELAADARHDNYVLHIPTGSWTKFTTSNQDQVVLATKNGEHLNNQCYGFIGSEGIVNLDKMYEPEVVGTLIGTNFGRYDESYDVSSGANTSAAVRSAIQFPDVRLFGGGVGRLHELILEHDIWKDVTTTINGYDVVGGTDPFFGNDGLVAGQSATIGNITPRYIANDIEAIYGYRFSTRLTGTTWPVEGTTFRLTLTTFGVSLHATDASYPPKVLGLRLLVEPSMERLIDNPITS
jgi:hypothetical protein